MRDCCLTVSDQKEEHISFWPDDNDVFFELDRYTQRKILVLFHRNESTEPVSEVGHIILAPRQPVFVLLLYMILHAKQTFFFYICIAVADPIIKKAEGCDPILQFTADTFLYQS